MKVKAFSLICRFAMVAVFVVFASLTTAQAYEAHLGIPTPWVDPDVQKPSVPADWSAEVPGYYYVDYTHGSDGRTYGTPGSPRRTIPNPIPAGSYVLVDGVYNYKLGGVIRIWGNGTSGNWAANTSGPVWIVGTGGKSRAEFTDYKMVISGSYIYFDNIYVRSGSRFQVGSYNSGEAAHHVLLRDSEVQGLPTDGAGAIVATVSSSSDPVDHVIFYNSVFHDTGNINSTSDDDAGIVVTSPYTTYAWILNNTMHTSSGTGVQINPSGASASSHHIYVGQNHVYNTRQSGIWVKYATDVIFSENTIHDIITTSWSPSKGMGAQYEPQRLWMINNTVYNVEYGVRVASTNSGNDWEIYILGNLIYDAHAPGSSYAGGSWDEACIHLQGGVTRYIYNNTLVNCDAGINLSSTQGSFYIKNNVIANITTSAGRHLFVEYQKNSTTVDNNLFYQNGNSIRVKWGSANYDLNSFIANTNQCDNCISDNPSFLSTLSANFNVASGAPTLDAGATDSIFAKFQSLYGLPLNKDIQGNSREQGNAIDIGAFEQQTGQSLKHPPSPPQLLNN